jgi:two-component system sensor histidine kinase PilS (NtrC family)
MRLRQHARCQLSATSDDAAPKEKTGTVYPGGRQKASARVRRSLMVRMLVSAIVITAFAIGTQYRELQTLVYTGYLYLVFGLIVLLSFLYFIALGGEYEYPRRLLRFQLLLDFCVVTTIVACTGGIYSVFAFLYIIVVLEVGILLSQVESLAAASLSSLLLGGIMVLTDRGVLSATSPFRPVGGEAVSHFVVQIFALYLTAFISSYWSFRLRRMQIFQRGLLNNMSSGFLITDESGIVRVINVAAQRILGYRLDEALGKSSRDVLRVVGGGADPMETTLRTGEEFSSYEFRAVQRNGQEIPLGITTNLLPGTNGRTDGAIGSFVDLTEVEKMRRELRNQDRLAAIGELAAGLAHEIRNPVAAIRGSVEELEHNLGDTATARSLADIAVRECDQLNQIVTGFLEFARNSAAAQQTFDLRGLLEETATLLGREARCTPALDIQCRADDQPVLVCLDRAQLKQAFLNIGKNSLEAMPEGGKLTISVEKPDRQSGHVQIVFRDSGLGIPPGEIERIFEPFFTTKRRGFGMGLAIVQKIISAAGGSVLVSSKEDNGTSVTVVLPLKQSADQPAEVLSAN